MNMPLPDANFHGAKLALFAGDALIVILRDDIPDIPWPNHWDMPGGGREGNETPLDCVLREVREELGLRIDPDCVVWGKRFDPPSSYKWFFVGHLPAGVVDDIVFGDEGQRWELMSPDQYYALPNHIARFADRLRLYLSGVPSDRFERPPAN
jgi:8-oxo-dGTP diphosphatase